MREETKNGACLEWAPYRPKGRVPREEVYLTRLSDGKTSGERVVSRDGLERIRNGGDPAEPDRVLVLMKREGLAAVREFGWHEMSWLSELAGKKQSPRDFLARNVFESAKEEGFAVVEIKTNEQGRLALESLDGEKAFPPIFLRDHVITELDDTKYRLDEFAEALSKRDDVGFLVHLGRWAKGKPGLLKGPLRGDEEGIGGVISDLEHHLEEGESAPAEKEALNLVFYPSQEERERLFRWSERKEEARPENRKRKIFFMEREVVRDLLGGDAFRIPTPEEESVPKRKFKS